MRPEHWIYTLPLRLRSLFRRQQVEQELDEELQYHLERKIEENLARGLTPEEARYAAMRAMEGLDQQKEQCRDMRQVNYVDNFLQDVRYGLRMLAKSPGFTVVAILTLALGIGANTAMFSIVDGALLKPLPVSHPDQFVSVMMRDSHGVYSAVSYPDFLDLRAQCTSMSGAVAFARESRFVNSMDEASMAAVDIVSLNYFDVLGVMPLLGRPFSSTATASAAAEPAVVISYTLWKNKLGGDPGIVGKTIRLNNQPVTVLGVGPPRFRGLARFVPTDAWLPVDAFDPNAMRRREFRGFEVVGRLRSRVAVEQIQAELDTIGHRLAQTYPATNKTMTFFGRTQSEENRGFVLVSLFLMFLVGLVLLISCANVAGLLLARGETRSREVAIRLAMGASRARLIRQLLTEGLIISLAGGSLALFLAARLIAIEPSLLPPAPIQIGPDLQIDARVLIVTLVVSLLATLIFGVAPALRASKADLTGALKSEETSLGHGPKRMTARNIVVIGQVALSVLMLSVAGLFLRSLMATLRLPLGFNPHKNLLVVPVGLLEGGAEQRRSLLARTLERVRGIPGVIHATCAMRLPLSGSGGGAALRISIPGIDLPEGQQTVAVKFNAVDPDYFQTVGTRVLKGRYFSSADSANGPKVVLISQTMAHRFWPNQDPLGRFLTIEKDNYQIIGIVEDVKIIHIQETPQPYMYFPFDQAAREGVLIAQTSGNPQLWIPAVKEEIWAIDKAALIVWIQTGESTFRSEESVYIQRMAASMTGSLSLLGIFLASVGLYGVVAYVANRRTREIGIRVALGATRKQILNLVLRQGFNLVLIGAFFGLVLAIGTGHFIAGMLYGVSPIDPGALIGSVLLAGIIALAACYLPARRATKVDPMVALRIE